MAVEITLTWHEVAYAAAEGVQRRIRRLAKGRVDRYGWDGERDVWGNDIESSASEVALAKAREAYWAPSPAPDYAGDVGHWFARSTSLDDGCLILYPDDLDDRPYALLTGTIPTFKIRGWVYGREGKQPRFDAGSRLRVPAYLVPQGSLRPFAECRSDG